MYDLDIDSDVDDVVDATLMLNLEAAGELDIAAAIVTADNQWAAPTWLAIADYYGRGDIPTGANTDDPGSHGSTFTQTIASTYGVPGFTDVSDFPSALSVQRSVLAAAANNSIDYITTGGLSSVKALLESTADGYSALDGVALVAAKIHSLWIVGGYWPSGAGISDFGGSEARAIVSDYILDNWPTSVPIMLIDIADGDSVSTGENVMMVLSADNPARAAWELYFGDDESTNKRPGWSQIAIMALARGVQPNSLTATDYMYTQGYRGTATVDTSTGATAWTNATDSNHNYMCKLLSDAGYVAAINALLLDPA